MVANGGTSVFFSDTSAEEGGNNVFLEQIHSLLPTRTSSHDIIEMKRNKLLRIQILSCTVKNYENYFHKLLYFEWKCSVMCAINATKYAVTL